MLIPLVVIIGYASHDASLISLLPGAVPMQFNTATCALLIAYHAMSGERWTLPIALVISVLTLSQDVLSIDMGIDQVIVHHSYTVDTPHPGRMSPLTALAYIMSVLAIHYRSKRMIAGVILLSTPPVLGHALRMVFAIKLDWLMTVPYTTTTFMALNTGVWFSILTLYFFDQKKPLRGEA